MGETADAEKGDRGLDGKCSMVKRLFEQYHLLCLFI
jgi:hypothetical protein